MKAFLIFPMLSGALVACGPSRSSQAPAAFVRDFYAWFVPASQNARESAASLVLRERASALADELRDALRVDEARRSHSDGEIVSLDFDPFTGSQDPCERYEVGGATRVGTTIRIDVFAVCSGMREANPTLTAEVVDVDGRWAFVNFHYTEPRTDLRTMLRQLADTSAT